ncbi:MAG: aminoacetone oxidase family FAD-binding enzyme [Spirochaetaceae bacterium]|nr:MAG: aminoacetone oxidase family FAD-binding enzyme [Spirochaetaceae bacterium]
MSGRPTVCVIGGGPAGMIAAGRAAEMGAAVVLLEQNRALGRKLLITGGGRCNVTNAVSDRHVLVSRYGAHAEALHSVFARFSPLDMRGLLRRFGLDTVEEAEGRVFPVTQKASSVRDALAAYLRAGAVEVRTAVRVRALIAAADDAGSSGKTITAAQLADGNIVEADRFILATGGVSRPETGSTGDGFAWVRDLGATVRYPQPSLVPIRVVEAWPLALQGLSIGNARLSVFLDGARQFAMTGKLLFTHFGLSGPVVLNLSQRINELAQGGPVTIAIDPLPDEDGGAVDRRLQAILAESPKKQLGNVVGRLVPARMASVVLDLAAVDPATPCSELARTARRAVVDTVKSLRVTFDGLLGTDRAVVSSGGVSPRDVDFTTMTLKATPNLAVVGDMLDFDRQSGGYSLQLCWSTGWVAGSAAAASAATASPAVG